MNEEMNQEKFEEIARQEGQVVNEEGKIILQKVNKQVQTKRKKPDLWARLSPKGGGIVFTMLPSEEPIQYSIATSSLRDFVEGVVDVIPIFVIRRDNE